MKKRDTYVPKVVDVADIQLPKELTPLVEKMAKNVHDVWAESRIKEGWTYGPFRDDITKTNPCLVPYENLPDNERTYDRNTAFGTLKLIIKLGFKISVN